MEKAIPKEPSRLEDTLAVWSEFKELTTKYNCLSLGEGSPEANPPRFVVDEMFKAVEEGHNQYFRNFGHPILVNAVAEAYGKKFNRELNPMTEVLATLGALGGLYSFIHGLTDPGDEVVLFEPCYPLYLDQLRFANAVVKSVPLEYKESEQTWKLNYDSLRKQMTSKTKLLIFNNPNNPTGKCFTSEEIQTLSDFLDKEFPNTYIISDEVYDFLTYDQNQHHHFANFNQNWNKTISIFSGGKIFSATGWKMGWAIGPAALIRLGAIVQNPAFYCFNLPVQVAMGRCMKKLNEPGYKSGENDHCKQENHTYLEHVKLEMQTVRDELIEGLKTCGQPIVPLSCESGYFVMANIEGMRDIIPKKYLETHDYEDDPNTTLSINRFYMPNGNIPLDLAVCRWLALEKKVVAMPNSFFYHPKSKEINENFIRLAICKSVDHTRKAVARLRI